MSDKNLSDKKYEAIDPDSIITVKINGKFYGDLRAVFVSMLTKDRTKEDLGKFYENFSQGKVDGEEDYKLFVIQTLLLGIEAQAKEQGFITKMPTPDLSQLFPEGSDSESSPSEQ